MTLLDIYETPASLKEQIVLDTADGAAWFNENEFAARHKINGTEVLCLLTKDTRNGKQSFVSKKAREEGVFNDSFLLFIRADEIAGEPKINEIFDIDGKEYFVTSSTAVGEALLKIGLEVNES